MKDETKAILAIFGGLAIIFLLMFASQATGKQLGEDKGKKEIRRQAVLEGVGEYKINENGNLEFHWKKAK